jgi:hypothetical protein
MKVRRVHDRLYLTNATVLLTHQMDAAYWHEWELFGLPGGLQLYLLMNLPIVWVVLSGARAQAQEGRSGLAHSWLLVGAGLFAVGFHGVHLLRGSEAFLLPVSLGLLAATLLLSTAQAATLRMLRQQARSSSVPGPGWTRPGTSSK